MRLARFVVLPGLKHGKLLRPENVRRISMRTLPSSLRLALRYWRRAARAVLIEAGCTSA